MNWFRKIKTAAFLDYFDKNGIELYFNPTLSEFIKASRNYDGFGRVLVDKRNGDIIAWNGKEMTHYPVIKFLTQRSTFRDKYPSEHLFALGYVTVDKSGKVYIVDDSTEGKEEIKNIKTQLSDKDHIDYMNFEETKKGPHDVMEGIEIHPRIAREKGVDMSQRTIWIDNF